MKKILISLLFSFNIICFAQTNKIPDNNLGLKITVTGASICMLGVSMKSPVVKQYNSPHGYTFTSVDPTVSHKKNQLNALIIGSICTIGGIVIQNLKNRKNRKK